MNFSEQLDQFVERGARDLFPCNPPCDSHGVCDNCVDAKLVRIGGASLKPIVLKLVDALEKYRFINANSNTLSQYSDAAETLAEIERMIGGEK